MSPPAGMWAHPLLQDVAIPTPHLLGSLRRRDSLATKKDELTAVRVEAVDREDIEAAFAGRRLREERVNRGISEPTCKFFGARERQRLGEPAHRLRDRQRFGNWEPGAGHDRLKQDFVGGGLIPVTVIASEVHQMLRLLADEGPLFL
ncbi:hypothetical protein [Acidisoma silvae]|uniref:Uncharacterized protein n=1 Tax=Acidisoma silvae TaxID=2802396 RepID=A0A963YX08_9PROT|nr:hypothetical protein [Acidisoma silvae]MCB8877865.1 hypothetical protein [Acidisoma silvae]